MYGRFDGADLGQLHLASPQSHYDLTRTCRGELVWRSYGEAYHGRNQKTQGLLGGFGSKMGRYVVVRVKGLEPPLPYGKQILSLPRLPFRHTRTAGNLPIRPRRNKGRLITQPTRCILAS